LDAALKMTQKAETRLRGMGVTKREPPVETKNVTPPGVELEELEGVLLRGMN
jgi:hypothetical protein